MKTREEVANFVNAQLHYTHDCKFPKGEAWHYGIQELRELMDFIYESEPTESEKIKRLPTNYL